MKKFILFFLIAINLFAINVFGATESVEYSFTITEGKRWNLETGVIQDDQRFTITNRTKIQPSTNNRIEFDALLFHHILFYDRFNNYLGYYNSPYSILETGDKYLGQLQNNYVDIPETASSFSLMNYSANANEYLTEYGLDQLENPITLNDLFFNGSIEKNLGENIIDNSTIETYTNPDFSFVESTIFAGYDEASNSHYMVANPSPSWSFPLGILDITYGILIDTFEALENQTYYLSFSDLFGTILDKDEDIYIELFGVGGVTQNKEVYKIYNHATDTITNNFEFTTIDGVTSIELSLYFEVRYNDGLTDLEINDLQLNDGYDIPITFYHNDLEILEADFLTSNQLLDLYLNYELYRNPNSVRYEELGYISLENFFENNNFLESADGDTIIYGRSTTFNNLFLDIQPSKNLFYPENVTFVAETNDYFDSYESDFIPLKPFGRYLIDGFNRENLLKENIFFEDYVIKLYDENQTYIGAKNATYQASQDNYFYRNEFLSSGAMPSYMKLNTSISDLDTFRVNLVGSGVDYELGLEPNTILNDINDLRTTGTISDSITTSNGDIILNRNVGYVENSNTPLIDLNGYTLDNVYNTELEGKNLVNKYNSILKTYINLSNGDLVLESNVGWETTQPINVIENVTYTASGYFVIGTGLRIAFYDNLDNYISGLSLGANLTETFTTPSNTQYLRVAYRNTDTQPVGNLQLEQGSTATPYEPYKDYLSLNTLGDFTGLSPAAPNKVITLNNRLTYEVNEDTITSNDQPLIELNGMTLNEVFENNLADATWNNYQTTHVVNNNIFTINSLDTQPALFAQILTINNIYYARTEYYTTNAVNVLDFFIGGSTSDTQVFSPNINQVYEVSTKKEAFTQFAELQARPNINGGVYYFIEPTIIDLSSLGLEHLPKEQLDQYFEIYQYFNRSVTSNDQPLAELNGLTLNEVFEDNNEWTYTIDNVTLIDNGDEYTFQTTDSFSRFRNPVINGNTYFISFNLKITEPVSSLWVLTGFGGVGFRQLTQYINEYHEYNIKLTADSNELAGPYFYDDPFDAQEVFIKKDPYLIDLTSLGIDNLTQEQLDRYYQIYNYINNGGTQPIQALPYDNDGFTQPQTFTYDEPIYYDIQWRLDTYFDGLVFDNQLEFIRFQEYKVDFANGSQPFYYEHMTPYQINLTDKLELYYGIALSLTELNEVEALYDNILASDNPYALGLQIIGGKRYYSMPDDYLIALDLLNVDPTLTNNQLEAYYQEYVDNLQIEANLYLNILGNASFDLANPQYDREIVAPSELDTDAQGFLENVLLDNLGFNNVIGRTILAIAVIFGAMFLLGSLNMPSSVIIGVGAMLYVALSFIGWVPAWITIIIVLVILVLLIFKFTSKGGGSNETDS